MRFEEMNIDSNILLSIKEMGFKEPTKIQTETIPIIKTGVDVIGQSQTGSGKTAAFAIPIIERTVKGKGVQALVLAPVRELAKQIAGDFLDLSTHKGLKVEAVYGGVAIEPQIKRLRDADIVVGTPGRILDHMSRRTIDTRNVKAFVLDEADKMINMGFIDDIRAIERQVPKDKQVLLFSATMPQELLGIANSFTRDAQRIKTSHKVSDDVLKQYYYDVKRYEKFSLLVHLMKEDNPDMCMVFCNTKRETLDVERNLRLNGIKSRCINGGLTQNVRERIMEEFKRGRVRCLVATNVAARGLDIDNVSHIFNYSIPNDAEDYVNRIGRTARAGKTGKAISFISRDDHAAFGKILRKFSYEVEHMERPDFNILPFESGRRSGFGNDSFRRNSGSRRGGRFSGGSRSGNSRSGNARMSRYSGRR